jgi:predicted AAA+ superfamily ATPase
LTHNAHIGMQNTSVYGATKAALLSLARTVSGELIGRGIRVSDFVTEGERGAGVAELIDKLIANDLSDLADGLRGEPILIGNLDGRPVTLPRYGRNVLVCGQSGSGKSTLVTGLLERITDLKYQLCLVDPEGDYENLPGCRTVGDEKHAPSTKQLKEALDGPTEQVIVNLVAVSNSERPERFACR